jgi:hypothetical protein
MKLDYNQLSWARLAQTAIRSLGVTAVFTVHIEDVIRIIYQLEVKVVEAEKVNRYLQIQELFDASIDRKPNLDHISLLRDSRPARPHSFSHQPARRTSR